MSDAPTFYQKLAAAAAELDYLQKTGKNAHFKYSFVTEAHVKERVKTALAKHGLVLANVRYVPIGECSGKAAVLNCMVHITDDGTNKAVFEGIGAGADSSDKAPMKACAAALKYALTSGFLIPTGDDPEDGSNEPKAPSGDKPTVSSNVDTLRQGMAAMAESAVKVGKATASTSGALLWAGRIDTAPSVKDLDGLLEGLTEAVTTMTKADADTVRSAFKNKRKALEGTKS